MPDVFLARRGEGKITSGNNRQVSVLSKNAHHVTCGVIIYHMCVCTQFKLLVS